MQIKQFTTTTTTTTTRILQGSAFLCTLVLLLFKPRWSYQKRNGFWSIVVVK